MIKKTPYLIAIAMVALAAISKGCWFLYNDDQDQSGTIDPESLELQYVFELVRHGARAPLLGASSFSVDAEMLTP